MGRRILLIVMSCMIAAPAYARDEPEFPTAYQWPAIEARARWIAARLKRGDEGLPGDGDALEPVGKARHTRRRIPIVDHPLVRAYLDYFRGRGKGTLRMWMRRAEPYRAMIEEELYKMQLPASLVWLAAQESGFQHRAVSGWGATGMWQFTSNTARMSGLSVNGWVDERVSPLHATRAAVRHLAELWQRYGDWYLVLAAYNHGVQWIDPAIRRFGTSNFFKLARTGFWKPETRHYVPKFLALMTVAAEAQGRPAKHRVRRARHERETRPALNGTPRDEVEVPPTDLKTVAKAAEVPLAALRRLNPQLLRGRTPPGRNYRLRIPRGTAGRFWPRFLMLDRREKIRFVEHRVRFGETQEEIIARYATLREWVHRLNHLRPGDPLRAMTVLRIPVRESAIATCSVAPPYRQGPAITLRLPAVSPPAGRSSVYYQVMRNDSLWAIARHFHVSISDLIAWNGLPQTGHIHPGKALRIYPGPGFDPATAVLYDPRSVRVETATAPARPSATQRRIAAAEAVSRRPHADDANGRSLRVFYVVQPGDSLWKIGNRFGLPMEMIRTLNGIKNARGLQPGQRLIMEVAPGFYSPDVIPDVGSGVARRVAHGKRKAVR